MTMVPPRVPNRCGVCGAQWYDTHTCPNVPRGTSAPQVVDMVRQVQGDPWAKRAHELAAENDTLRWALREARDELARWGWGDMHYGQTPQEQSVVDTIAKIDKALGGKGRD